MILSARDKFIRSIVTGMLLALFTHPSAAIADDFVEALKGGKISLDARYRYENVSQDGIALNANAHTVRTRLGYKSGVFHGASLMLEFENITALNDNFNSTRNGNVQFPVVADPSTTEVNQAYLNFKIRDKTSLKGGRQVTTLDNHRYVGHVGFRQNQQTFDAITVTSEPFEKTKLFYSWIGNVNRIFSDRSPVGNFQSNSHILNISNESLPIGKITGYVYLIDLVDAPGLSSATYGLRLSGSQTIGDSGFKLLYTGEYARQNDFGDNAANFGVDYLLVEGGAGYKGLTAKVGYEKLGSDGVNRVTTPLATLHAHNGWADVFLATPPLGLNDLYVSLQYTVQGIKGLNGLTLHGVYHDFSADFGGADYGSEWDFRIAKEVFDYVTLEFKYANYSADTFATDRRKLWFTINFKI